MQRNRIAVVSKLDMAIRGLATVFLREKPALTRRTQISPAA
ncbi:hypothetical protein [Ralstonia solanacearum]|nr:hypothetical protein [Ralstonia solanacearum]